MSNEYQSMGSKSLIFYLSVGGDFYFSVYPELVEGCVK
jgi:hypothetical protein